MMVSQLVKGVKRWKSRFLF